MLRKLFLYLIFMTTKDFAAASRRLIDQKDISEHCRRRVVPSVFLGQRVMAANSQVMQFSPLDLPYSCSLSVRAEAGSNIILVVQLISEDTLMEACSISGDQLVVYELGETFGGYWGPIPNMILRESPKNYTQYYTLKTGKPHTTSKRKPQSTPEKIITVTETQSTVKEQEYYTMDVPIVNVSGNFQLGTPRETHDSEDLFNYIYDITPRNGVEYETSILPLVQFSVRQQTNVYGGEERLYELDYDSKGFTMDPRLIFNTAKKKKTSLKKYWRANKRYRHGTKSSDLFRRRDSKKLLTVRSPYINEVIPTIPNLDSKYLHKSWHLVDDIIKSINVTTVRSTIIQNEFRNILHNILNSQHNSSVYLANISIYNDISNKENDTSFPDGTDSNQAVDNSTKLVEINTRELDIPTNSLQSISERKSSQVTLGLSETKTEYGLRSKKYKTHLTDIHGRASLEDIQKDVINTATANFTLNNNRLKEIITIPNTFTSTNKSTKTAFLTGAMVDHESWENIVQAAPVMAVVLNKTEPLINNTITNPFNSKNKRHIQSLEIDQSRPRNLTTKPSLVTNTPEFDDLHDLVRMIELEDDEIGSRVALRYVRQYVGPALFNLCDHRDHSLKQIFLFNSSRIVISISNFTLDRLMLVLTPAQTLHSGVSRCPGGQLECQIVGTRVCIDSLNACDGVPNCGSYEIYDEDRLSCGTAHGVHRSVCLAALSFLAVILTAAYIALYWLERCVPRVSDAFFIYSDSSENELFLDSIMRSPNDDEDLSCKINFSGHFFEDDALYEDINAEEKKVHLCKRIFTAWLTFLGLRKHPTVKPSENDAPENQLAKREATRMFSFTQFELRKFGRIEFKEEAVQVGDIFEMQDLNCQRNKEEHNSLDSWTKLKAMEYQCDPNRQQSELNLLKFSKESRSFSSEWNSIFYENTNATRRQTVGIGTDGELEIKNTEYEPVVTPRSKIPVICEVHTENKRMGESSKRIRFDEELKMISAIKEDDNSLRLNNEDSDNLQVQEADSSGRDFMRFWGGKGKKTKKKKLKHLSLI